MKKYKWLPQDIYNTICEYLESLKQNEEIIVWINKKETRETRSLAQNNTFWKLFTEIWNKLWYKKEEIHDFMLWWVFWTYEVKIWPITKQMLNKPKTSELNKEEWIHFIDAILEFCKSNDIGVEITSKEIQSLYDSYN